MLTQEDARERMAQNVGDVERWMRAGVGLALIATAVAAPRGLRSLLRVAGAGLALSGLAGWCPAYHSAGVTSGPGDPPGEAARSRWITPLLAEISR
jgi:hypothetical protein